MFRGTTARGVVSYLAATLLALTFFAPASMPRDKVDRLARLIQEVMKDPDTARRFKDSLMVPVVSTQAQTVAMLKAYRAQWSPVVQKSGYQP